MFGPSVCPERHPVLISRINEETRTAFVVALAPCRTMVAQGSTAQTLG